MLLLLGRNMMEGAWFLVSVVSVDWVGQLWHIPPEDTILPTTRRPLNRPLRLQNNRDRDRSPLGVNNNKHRHKNTEVGEGGVAPGRV